MRARSVFVATALAAALLIVSPSSGQAHAGGSFCDGFFEGHGSGTPRSDGTQLGHGEGQCTATFQGLPAGVVGFYEAGDPDAPAEIHVEAYGVTASGTWVKLAECEAAGTGSASCEQEEGLPAGGVTLPEPLPDQIVRVECLAHSHARIKVGTAPVGQFGCYTTDEAGAALRDHMDMPPTGEQDDDDPGQPAPGDGGLGTGSVIATVPRDTYAPPAVLVARDEPLTYVNLDANRHDVVARVYAGAGKRETHVRPDGSAPWCADFEGDCPLFWSELIAGPGSSTPVLGLEDAEVGATYEFYCTIHPYMVGTLTVVR